MTIETSPQEPNDAIATDHDKAETSAKDFYVVALGASAGGLKPLEIFFENLTPMPEVAFVVIQHLSPDFKSLMNEILGRRTQLNIFIAEEGMEIRPNAIYLIPAGQDMVIRDLCLNLSPQKRDRTPNYPINLFFQSLADDLQEQAIGIVLSGTGSDGSQGLQHIHERGGITLVQDPTSAEFDGMPQTAISTGCIDYVAVPNVLAQMVNDLSSPSFLPADWAKYNNDMGVENHELKKIISLLAKHEGIDFSQYKPATLGRRIDRRRLLNKCKTIADYTLMLDDSSEERSLLRRDFLINVTQFFRDEQVWEYFKEELFRSLIQDLPPEDTLRIWVTACATGEEAYSVGILVRELFEELNRHNRVQIFATDLDQAALDKAAMGIYDEAIVEYVTPERLDKFFTHNQGHYTIKRSLREMLIFSPHDLTQNASLTRMHLVCCRNVLIYMQPTLQQYVLRNLHFSLVKNGILILGTSEDLGHNELTFEVLHPKYKLFRKVTSQVRQLSYFRNKSIPAPIQTGSSALQKKESQQLLDDAFETYLAAKRLTCLLFDVNEKLLVVCADHLDLLRIPKGLVSERVRALLPQSIHVPFISAMNGALREKSSVTFHGLAVDDDETSLTLDLVVSYCQNRQDKQPYLILELVATTPKIETSSEDLEVNSEVLNRFEQMELELSYTRENLQATIEELESTNEEQQATNEELIASNEELQSTNEELHAVNEELYTVNNEHQSKIQELIALSNDIDNLFRSTEIGVVFLDQTLRVRKYTPAANQVFQFLPSDIGRPLKNLAVNVNFPLLLDVISESARTGASMEQEIITNDKHLLIRIHPYLDSDDEQQGVVMSVIDTTATRQAQIELQAQRIKAQLAQDTLKVFQERYQQLYHETPVMMYSIDPEGIILDVSNYWVSKLGYPRSTVLNQSVNLFLNPESQDRFQEILPSFLETGLSIDVPIQVVTQSGDTLDVLQSMIAERNELGHVSRCLVVTVDITDRKQAEAARQESEERFRAMADNAPVLIWLTNAQGECTYLNEEWLNYKGCSLEAALELGWEDGIHPDDLEKCRTAYRQAIADPQLLYLEYRRCDRNGTYRWLLDTAKPRILPSGEFAGMIGSCIDINLQKQAEEALSQVNLSLEANLAQKDASLQTIEGNLQESETRFYTLADHAPVLIWLSDAQGNCTYVNRVWQMLTGRAMDEHLGQGWLESVHPEDRTHVQATFQQSIDDQCPFEFEFRQTRSDGVYRWILATGIPRTAGEQFAGLICSCMDITELKHSQQRLEQAISELQRSNQELEQFAYIASHDLREPLRKIKSFAELLQDDLTTQLDEKQGRYFEYIMSGADRMQNLIQDILEYSRIANQSKPIEKVDLNLVLGRIRSDLSLVIEENQAVIEYESLPTIDAHKVEITQVFHNLINNAIKFRSEASPKIRLEAIQQEGKWVVTLTDNGIGIQEEYIERIFIMFQRLHNRDQYPGTGIGLALCRKVIESYGGTITCSSVLGEGTTFRMKLPVHPVVPILQ